MIEEDTGHIYIMDLEANNVPRIGASVDKRLSELKEFLENSIQENK
ncbi:hypothetical protein [Vibrio quintilis]|nr:hypothetical protein [Vibrio quintilis]